MIRESRLTERCVRLLLRCAPAAFREGCGDEIVATIRDRCRAAARTGSRRAALVCSIRELANLGRTIAFGSMGRPDEASLHGSPRTVDPLALLRER